MSLPSDNNLFSISKASSLLGVSSDTLRRLEKRGKVIPKRGPGGARLYSLDDITLLKQILKRPSLNERTYSIQEAAGFLNVSPQTMRRWEREGKLTSARTPGGHRLFTTKDIQNIKASLQAPKPSVQEPQPAVPAPEPPATAPIPPAPKAPEPVSKTVYQAPVVVETPTFREKPVEAPGPQPFPPVSPVFVPPPTPQVMPSQIQPKKDSSKLITFGLLSIILLSTLAAGKFLDDQIKELKTTTRSLRSEISSEIANIQNLSQNIALAFKDGSVIFGKEGGIGENNEKFFWDDTKYFLGIGTNTPDATLTISGEANAQAALFKAETDGDEVASIDNQGNLATSGDIAVGGGNITSTKSLNITTNASGADVGINAADDIIFNDAQLSSAIKLSETSTSLPGGNTGIVDAINAAYNRTGGDDDWTVTGTVIHPTTTSLNLAIGGNSDAAYFYIDASNGNIKTSGDLTINGGDIFSGGSSISLVVGNGTSVSVKDGTNTLASFKDQGDYVFLNLKGKATTGDPVTCSEGDLYYNATDDTVKVCHSGDTWEGLDGGAGGSSFTDITSGTNITAAMVVGSGASLTYSGTGTITASDLTCTNCLDFSEFEDTLDLDANLILNQTAFTWTQNFTGDTTVGLTYNANSLTTGTALALSSTGTSFNGELLTLTKTGASGSTAFTSDIANIAYSQTYDGGVALDTTGNVLDISRSLTLNNSGNTLTVSGAVATISDSFSLTLGSLVHTADVLRVAQNSTFNTGSGLNITSAGATGGFVLRANDDGTFTDSTPFVITNAGDVGINNTTPLTKLHIGAGADAPNITTDLYVSNAGTTSLEVRDSTSNISTVLYSGGDTGIIGTRTNHPLYFQTNSNNNMALDTLGNLGIGTIGPSARLDLVKDDASTSTQIELQRIQRTTSGTAADGIGLYTSAFIENDGGGLTEAARWGAVMRDANVATALGGEFNVYTQRDSAGESLIDVLTAYADAANKWICGNSNKLGTDGYDCFGFTIGSGNDISLAFDGAEKVNWNFNSALTPDRFQTQTNSGVALSFTTLGAGEYIEFDEGNDGADLYIDSTGNIGVGNAVPTTALHIGTGVETHTLATGDVLISSDLEIDGVLYLDGGTLSNVAGTGSLTLTATPTTTTNSLTGSSWLVENPAIGNVGMAALLVNQVNAGDIFTASAGGSPKFTITNAGNVGIGTTSPTYKLDISINNTTAPTTGGGDGLGIINTDTTANSLNNILFRAYDSGGVGRHSGAIVMGKESAWSGTDYPGYLSFWTRPVSSGSEIERLRITSTGNVGIGTTSPQDKVEVAGSIRITDTSQAASAWALSRDGAAERGANALAVYNGYLYAGQGSSPGNGDIYYFNGSTWNLSYDGGQDAIQSLAVYNGKLYAGQGSGGGDAEIFVCNPATAGDANICDNVSDWTTAYDDGGATYEIVIALAVYNGKFYAGLGNNVGDGDIVVCNPATAGDATTCDNALDWTTALDSGYEEALSLVVYNGMLYAGMGNSAGDGDIYKCAPDNGGDVTVCDNAADWAVYSPTATAYDRVRFMAVYNGKLYAGMGYLTGGFGDVIVCDPTSTANDPDNCDNASEWTVSFNGAEEEIPALAVYNGKLYAGQGRSANGDGDVYVFNGAYWAISYAGAADIIDSLAVYNGKLYAGQGLTAGEGDIYTYTEARAATYPVKFSVGTGTSQKIGNLWFENKDEWGTSGSSGADVGVFKLSHALITTAGLYDVVEDYPTYDSTLSAGEIVAIDPFSPGYVTKASAQERAKLVGVISTDPGIRLSQESSSGYVPVSLVGRVPVQVDPAGPAFSAGDPLTVSTRAGKAIKANSPGVVIGKALENWQPGGKSMVMVFINLSWYDQEVYLTDSGELNIQIAATPSAETAQETQDYNLLSKTGEIIDSLRAFGQLVVGKIRTGSLIAKEGFINQLAAATATVDNLLITSGLVSPSVKTGLILPLTEESNVKVEIGQIEEDATAGFGEFIIQDATGSAVASIDTSGNATFSGTVAGNSLEVATEATIGGTLYADRISSTTLDDIQALLAQVEADQEVLAGTTRAPVATASDSAILTDLYVLNQAAVNSLSIGSSIAVGTDMVIQSGAINTVSSTLSIQSLAAAPVEIMAGKVRIETNGDVTILGNLNVAGDINSQSLTVKENGDSGKLISVVDAQGNEVALIDASGSARFNDIAVGRVAGTSDVREAVEIAPGATSAVITKTWASAPGSVIVTPSYNTSVWVTDISQNGFTLNVSVPPEVSQKLYWWAVW